MSPLAPNLDVSDLFSVKGLNVVITGGGGDGLGAMMTRALARNGANKIFIIGRRQSALEATVSSCSSLCPSGTVIPVQGDITSKASLTACVSTISSQIPSLDVLIANSGITGPTSHAPGSSNPPTLSALRDFWWNDVSLEDFTQVSHVNVTGAMYTVLAFLPLLMKTNDLHPPPSDRPRPLVVCVTSIGAYLRELTTSFAYQSSKMAAEHLMRMLATRLTAEKIRVNTIAPGIFMTEMSAAAAFQGQEDTRGLVEGDKPASVIPLTRAGGEEDIAGTILYLCSRAGAFLSGNTIVLDGGRVAVKPAHY